MFNYRPTPTGLKFHESDADIKLALGPYGSGKSTFCAMDTLYYALSQNVSPDGKRYTRIGVVRNTFPMLMSTTRNSLIEVYSDLDRKGGIRLGGSPVTGKYVFPVGDGDYEWVQIGRPWQRGTGDGTLAQVEFVLQALDDLEFEATLKSQNWTFAWVNEGSEFEYEVFAAIAGRTGRYPSEDMGGCTYSGMLVDTNMPPQGHWMANVIKNPPPGWEVFVQPVAATKHEDRFGKIYYVVNPHAENLRNLGSAKKPDDYDTWDGDSKEAFLIEKGKGYYEKQITMHIQDARFDKIDTLFCMLDVPLKEGRVVFPKFDRKIHVAKNIIEPIPNELIVVGYDTSGIHPAVNIGQFIGDKWAILDELYGDNMGFEDFFDVAFTKLINEKYSTNDIFINCDPANARDQMKALSPVQHIRARGFKADVASTNSPKERIRAVEVLLNKNVGGLIISPHCELLIKALESGYKYKKINIKGSMHGVYADAPNKDHHSHPADALQYLALWINRKAIENSEDTEEIKQRFKKKRRTAHRVM